MIFKHCIRRLKPKFGRAFIKEEDIVKSHFTVLLPNCKTRNRQKHKTKEMDLTEDYLYSIYQAQGGRCIFSGIKMLVITRATREANNLRNVWNNCSIDRIDSKKPYMKGNVQLVCNVVNKMKMNLPNEDFLNVCHVLLKKNWNKPNVYHTISKRVKNIK